MNNNTKCHKYTLKGSVHQLLSQQRQLCIAFSDKVDRALTEKQKQSYIFQRYTCDTSLKEPQQLEKINSWFCSTFPLFILPWLYMNPHFLMQHDTCNCKWATHLRLSPKDVTFYNRKNALPSFLNVFFLFWAICELLRWL